MKNIMVDADKLEHLLNCMAQLNFIPVSGMTPDETIIKKAYVDAREMLHNAVETSCPPPISPRDLVSKHVEDKMRSRYSALEGLAKEFLAHTGLTPDRCELVEQQESDGRTSWKFVERDKMFSIPVPGTADGQIRDTLITNAKAGKFGDIKIDESASTLHILVHVLEHLLKPPQVWYYDPGNQASHEAALAAAREASDRANVVMPTHYGPSPIAGVYSAWKKIQDAELLKQHGEIAAFVNEYGHLEQPWKCSKCQNIYGNLETTNREAIFAEDGTTQIAVRQTISHHCGPCGNVEKKTTNHCVYCNAEDGSRHQDDCKWLKGQLLKAAKKINEATNSRATPEMYDKAMQEIVQSMPLVDEGRCPVCLAAEGDCENAGWCGAILQQRQAKEMKYPGGGSFIPVATGQVINIGPKEAAQMLGLPEQQGEPDMSKYNKYVQIVEPKYDHQYDPPDDDTPMPTIVEKPK